MRVAGKLIRKSLKTDVLSVAKLRLADFDKQERHRAESTNAVGRGRMSVGNAIALHLQRVAGDGSLKPRTKDYYMGRLFRGTKAGLELVKILIALGADLCAIGNRPVHLEGRAPLEGVLQQLKEKTGLIRALECRPREDWEAETLTRWKSEASIYQKMVEELIRAKGWYGCFPQ